jgi:hypothetical protein
MTEFDREQVAKKLAETAISEGGCNITDQVVSSLSEQSLKELTAAWKLADAKSKQLTKETGQSPVVDFTVKKHSNLPLNEIELNVQVTDPRIDPPHQTIFSASRPELFGFMGDWRNISCHRPQIIQKQKIESRAGDGLKVF